MKKVLFIHHATGISGSAISMLNTINAIDKFKYSIHVLLVRDSIISKMLLDNDIKYDVAKSVFYKKYYSYFVHSVAGNDKLYRLDLILKRSLSWILSRFYFAPQELVRYDYDIVHLNSSVLTDWLSPCKAKGKVIIHIREPFSRGSFGLRHWFLTLQMRKYSDKIIAISKDNARRINIPEKTQVVYNFVNIRPDYELVNLNPTYGNVLYLGGYEIIKGFLTVVEALDYLDKDIKIVFCGNYTLAGNNSGFLDLFKNKLRSLLPIQKKLQSALMKINNHPNAIFVGLVNNTTKMIQETEFLISPFSKPHFSRPIFEAFVNKRCVISSDVEGMDEIVDHRINGLIVEKDSPVKLAEAINFLHDNYEKRCEMAENGYNKAKKKFSHNNVLQIQKIYDTI